jgi:hypothetical protein
MGLVHTRQLKKLSNRQIADDIKNYLKDTHEFYSTRAPELRVLAKRLHEEYTLSKFYKVFSKFWKSPYPEEVCLAVYTLQLYKEELNIETWKFIKLKIKDIVSGDQADFIARYIMGEILVKHSSLEKEILTLAKSKDTIKKRIALSSTIPLIEKKDITLAMKIIDMYGAEKDEGLLRTMGVVLQEIGKVKPSVVRKYISQNVDMPMPLFHRATEDMPDLRRRRQLHQSKNGGRRFLFWR